MTTVDIHSASKALGGKLSKRYAKNAQATSGFISTVTNDSTGRPKTAIVQLPGGTTVSVAIPYGSNIYPGISVSLVNDGSPSLASWRIANSSSASPITLGGQIVNTNGSLIINFDSIWVKDRGYIMAGGFADILEQPTGPRVMMNEYGLFGYAIEFPEPVISMATIESDELHVGDALFGYKRPGHANLLISPEQGLIEFDVNDTPFLVINGATGNRLEDYLWIGPSSGPQVGMGKMLGVAEFAMRDLDNRYVFLVRSDPMRVQVGATDDSEGWIWDSGSLDIRGSVSITGGLITGSLTISDTGALIWNNGRADASGISVEAYDLNNTTGSTRNRLRMTTPTNEELSWIGGYYTTTANSMIVRADSSLSTRNATMSVQGISTAGKAVESAIAVIQGSVTDGVEGKTDALETDAISSGSIIAYIGAYIDAGAASLIRAKADNTRIGDGGTTNYANFDVTGTLTMHGSAAIKSLPEPVDAQDAATKNYVDSSGGGGLSQAQVLARGLGS